MWSVWLVFCGCVFHSVYPLKDKDTGLMAAYWWERLTEVETGSCSGGRGHAQFSSVQSLSRVQHFMSTGLQHARPPCPSPTPGVHPNSCPLSRGCHPSISSSVVPFFSCPQSLPASESFPMTQDRQVMVKRSDRRWSTGKGNGKPLRYSCLENPMNSMKRQKDRTLKDDLPRSVDAQYATEDQWRNKSRKNEGMEPKQKQHPAVDVTGNRSKVWCYKEQYCMGTWNVSSMSQGKLEVVEQEMEEWMSTF